MIQHFTRVHQQAPPQAVDTLTAREMDVFRLITRGLSNAEIGRELFISDTTVKTHVTRLLQKLDLRDRAQAIVLAYQTGLFDDGRDATSGSDADGPGPSRGLRRSGRTRARPRRRRADGPPFLASRTSHSEPRSERP